MNTPFKPVSDAEWLDGIIKGADQPIRPSPLRPGQTSMLILIVAVAIAVSFGIEMIVHRLKNTYEIEWPAPVIEPKNALALEIAQRLRQNGRKPERQVNKAFKVASGAAW